jgi:hypothetical protein
MATEIQNIQRSYLDIWEPIVQDNSVDWFQYRDVQDENLNYADSNNDFKLHLNDRQNFFLPSKSYLEIRFQLKQTNGTNFAAGDNVSLQNNAIGLMRRWEFLMDDSVVDYVDDADISTTVQNLVYASDGYSASIASQQLWYPDTVDGTDIEYVIANGANLFADGIETVNTGHRKRQLLLNTSRILSVHVPLKSVFGFLRSFQDVTKGIKLGLRLTRNDNQKLLLGSAGTVVINKIIWWVPQVRPNPSVIPKLEAKLSSQELHTVPFLDTQIYRGNLMLQQASDQIFQIRTKRKRPVKVYVVFQTQARLEGDHTTVKRVFDHINITKLRVVLNATTQYPEKEYVTLFGGAPPPPPANIQDDYARVYSEYLRCALRDHDIEQGTIVTFDNFKTLFPVFCFDLSEKPEYFVEPESALLEVYYSNSAAIPHYCWVIIESEAKCYLTSNQGQMKLLKVEY